MKLCKTLFTLICLSALLTQPVHSRTNELPDLGNAGASLISKDTEHKLGRAWLRGFKSQVRTVDDPLMTDYLEDLIFRLATHSKLEDRRLELVVVHNKTINAFAVPGGVVGVHDGLLLHAQTEGELASVLAHELGHLSQHHFARGVEKSRQMSTPSILALLGSMVIAATVGGDAGMAAMTAAQAAAQQSKLRFSRQNELEADRIGIQNLVEAGMDPSSASVMFERMQRAARYSRRPPEFLLTHPVTERRIAYARSQAQKFPAASNPPDIDYQHIRSRVQVSFAESPGAAIKLFNAAVKADGGNTAANRYGLALAYSRANKFQQARPLLYALIEENPHRIAYYDTLAELENNAGRYQHAAEILQQQLRMSPENHTLSMRYANTLLMQGHFDEAVSLLEEHAKRRPSDDSVWYLLAETYGLAGQIAKVHEARAEYFTLNGIYSEARKQLSYALKLAQGDYLATEKLREKMQQLHEMQEQIKL
jgi:predicted Zn-dependent protease